MQGQHATRWAQGILAIIFLIVLGIRILIAFQEPLPDYAAYGHLRQVAHIKETGAPLIHDDLGFGGRENIFSPFYDYLLALLGLIMPPIWLVKIIPNVFGAMLVFPAYLLTRHITENEPISVITAAMAAVVPATLAIGINDASSLPLTLTLLVTAAYLFLKSRKSGKHLSFLLITLVLLSLISPLSNVLLIALLIYLGLLKLQNDKPTGKELEVLLFFLFFNAWYFLIIYKRAFIAHGGAVIWQNIPSAELSSVFSRITLFQAVSSTGIITLILGVFAMYAALAGTHKKSLALLSSLFIAALAMVWFRMVALEVGLAVLGLVLAIASGYSLFLLLEYVRKTKAARAAWLSIAGLIVLFLASAVPASLTMPLTDAPTPAEHRMLSWAKASIPESSVILASPKEGELIAAVSGRKTVADTNYLLVPRMDERYEDMVGVYQSFFTTDAVSNMQKYGATHILVSPQTSSFSGTQFPRFLEDETDCFVLLHEEADEEGGSVLLYERRCSIKEGLA